MKIKQSFFLAGLLILAMSPAVFAAEWQHDNTLKGERVNALAASGANLFAGTRDSGVFRSTDSGASWTRVNAGLTDLWIRALAVKGTYLFAGAKDSGMFRSGDNGATWFAMNTGMSSTNIRALAVNDSFLFAGTDGGGVCRSSDNGEHWLAVNKLDDGTELHFKSIYSFGVNSSYVFIGTWGGSAFRSADNGTTWYLITNGLWDPRENVIPYAWAVGDTFIFAGTSGRGVVRAKDSARVWFPATAGLPDSAIITALTLYHDTLFAATQKGIFVSSDNGDSWGTDNSGLSDTAVLAFAVSGNQLVAGTNGGGIWRRSLSGTSLPTAPGAPISLSPTDTAKNISVNPVLLWHKAVGAVSYKAQVSTATDFATLTKDSSLTDTSASFSGLATGTQYYWRVDATNSGGTGNWSTTRSFTTLVAIPGLTVLIAPVSGDTVKLDSVILKWHANSPGITGYHVEISADSGFTSGVISYTPTDTSQVVASLLNGVTYYWHFQAKNIAGSGPYSQAAKFIVNTSTVSILPKGFFVQNLGLAGDGMLRFGLAKQAHVTIKLFDLRGILTETLINEVRNPGYYTLRPEGMSNGSYILSFKTNEFQKTMLFIKQ